MTVGNTDGQDATTPPLEWRSAEISNPSGNCVEVADLPDGGKAIRDGKEGDKSPVLRFTQVEWEHFKHGALRGEFG